MSDTIQPSTTVFLASFAALLGALSMGLALGYTAPAFIDMEHDRNSHMQKNSSSIFDPDKDKFEAQKSLIGSTLAVGALFGGLLCEPSNKYLGRRISLIIFGFPFIAGWLFMALANSVTLIVMGRLVTGLCCGLVSGTAPSYVVEIAPPKIRGLLGTSFQVMVVIGIMLAALFGLVLSWKSLAAVSLIASIIMSLLMYFMPETPQWLLSKGRNEEAETSLKMLRTSAINIELDAMIQSATNAQNAGSQYSLELLKNREFYKPFILALALMFFQQFSGINAVLFYQSDIFVKAGSDAASSTIYVCLAQVIATIIGSILVDLLGRKMLLFGSGLGHAISLLIFGIYSNVSASDPVIQKSYAWLALVSLIVFVSSFSIGYGPIPWMMIPELSSSRVRSMIASLGTAFNWMCVWIVTAYVKKLIVTVGDDRTYWIFAIICAISCVFVVFCLPETKGKSAEQIQRQLLGEPRNQHQDDDNGVQIQAGSLKALA